MAGFEVTGIVVARQKEDMNKLVDYRFVNIHHQIDKVPFGSWLKNETLKTAGQCCRAAAEY